MSISTVTAYLFFNGNAAQAIAHYERALGARTEGLMRYGDTPGDCPDAIKGQVMHALLRIGAGAVMVSDTQPNRPVPTDGAGTVALELDDVDETTKMFGALGEGGQVIAPLHDSFWGTKFGALKDAYGVSWMLDCGAKPRPR